MRPDHTVPVRVMTYELGVTRAAAESMLVVFGVRRVRHWWAGHGWCVGRERWDEDGVERVCEWWVRMREQAEHYGRGLRETKSYHEEVGGGLE